MTVQAQILGLLKEMQREFNSAIVLITHDLGVIAEAADDVLVMYAGRAIETGPTSELLTHPAQPYTLGLLESVPDVIGDVTKPLVPIPGTPPSLLNPPGGCAFHPRCRFVDQVGGGLCASTLPELRELTPIHQTRCHLPDPASIATAIGGVA